MFAFPGCGKAISGGHLVFKLPEHLAACRNSPTGKSRQAVGLLHGQSPAGPLTESPII